MKKLKVMALVHAELVPPDSLEGMDAGAVHKVAMEYDVVYELRQLGHEVRVVGLKDELAPMRQAIDEFRPDVAFNMLAHFQNVGAYEAYVMSLLELLHVPYTGCNARGILVAVDKALSKKVLTYHRIRVPQFAVFRRGQKIRPPRVPYPLFVKSLDENSSVGIAQASVVNDEKELRERVEFVHDYVGSDAIAEQYIRGREMNVGVLGNDRLRAFGVRELRFGQLPPGNEPIATWRVKWDQAYQEKLGIVAGPADLPKAELARIQRMARRIYRVLGLTGYGRVDLRMDDQGQVWVLECNPNPDLSHDEDFSKAAADSGIPYPSLIQRILNLALQYTPPWYVDRG